MNERRSDVGLKLIYGIAGALIMFVLSLFFNHTYGMAVNAQDIAQDNRTKVAVLEQTYKDIDRRLQSIDLKMDRLVNIK